MDDKRDLQSFQIISLAGDAYSLLQEVLVDVTKKVEDNVVDAKIAEAKVALLEAHKVHAEVLSESVSLIDVKLNLLMIHAEDHFVRAQILMDLVPTLVNQNRIIRSFVK